MAQINEPSFLFLGAGDSPQLPQNHHHRSEAFRKVSGGQQGAGTGHLLTSSFPSPSSFRDQLSAHRPTSAGFCWIPLYPFLVTVPSAGGRESQGAEESPGDQMSCGRCARAVAHSVPKPGESTGTRQGHSYSFYLPVAPTLLSDDPALGWLSWQVKLAVPGENQEVHGGPGGSPPGLAPPPSRAGEAPQQTLAPTLALPMTSV